MKNHKPESASHLLSLTKIEVFHSLTENFGSKNHSMDENAPAVQQMNFKLDRLFSIFHQN